MSEFECCPRPQIYVKTGTLYRTQCRNCGAERTPEQETK